MRWIVTIIFAVLPAAADWSASYRLGEDFLQQGRTEDALRVLKAALEERPGEAAILDALGRTELTVGRYRSAKRYFEKASLATTDNAVPLTNMAQACFALREYRRAEQLLRQALACQPGSGEAWRLLGQVLFKFRRYQDAESAWTKAQAIAYDPLIWSDLGVLYAEQHRDELGIEMLRRAISEGSPGQRRARVRANLAELQWKHGDREGAKTGFQRALDEMQSSVGRNHPDIAAILEKYSQVLKRSGLKAEAQDAADRAARIHAAFDFQTNRNGLTTDWRDDIRPPER